MPAPATRQFTRYLLAGGSAAVLDAMAFHTLLPHVDGIWPAAAASFVIGAVYNFFAMSTFVYRVRPTVAAAVKYALGALSGLVVNTSVTWLVAVWLAQPPLAGKLAGIAAAFVANYLINTHVIFKRANTRQP